MLRVVDTDGLRTTSERWSGHVEKSDERCSVCRPHTGARRHGVGAAVRTYDPRAQGLTDCSQNTTSPSTDATKRTAPSCEMTIAQPPG